MRYGFYPLPTWIGHRLYICCFGFTFCCFYCVLMYGCASPSHCFSLVRTLDQSPFLFGCIYCLSLVSIWLYLVLQLLFSLSLPHIFSFTLDWTLFFSFLCCFYFFLACTASISSPTSILCLWTLLYLVVFVVSQIYIFGHICIFGRSKYGQVGCLWKDLAKCSSDALFLGQ